MYAFFFFLLMLLFIMTVGMAASTGVAAPFIAAGVLCALCCFGASIFCALEGK